MQQIWLALIGGLILGWLIEWIVDWQFWRRSIRELRQENEDLRRQLADVQTRLAALEMPPETAKTATTPAVADAPGVPAAPTDPQIEGE